MSRNLASALGTILEQWSAPAVRAATHLLLHFGSSAFWISHGKKCFKIRPSESRREPTNDYLFPRGAQGLPHQGHLCPLLNNGD